MIYHPAEVEHILTTIKILVDTREHDTPEARARWAAFGCPFVRFKLDFGDYSAYVQLPDGSYLSLDKSVVIERKMDLDELASCFTAERPRFTAEFERAASAGAKTYLLVETATWEKAFAGNYRSRVHPNAIVASLTAWMARYNCQLIFCAERTTGKLIAEILRREMKERLEHG